MSDEEIKDVRLRIATAKTLWAEAERLARSLTFAERLDVLDRAKDVRLRADLVDYNERGAAMEAWLDGLIGDIRQGRAARPRRTGNGRPPASADARFLVASKGYRMPRRTNGGGLRKNSPDREDPAVRLSPIFSCRRYGRRRDRRDR